MFTSIKQKALTAGTFGLLSLGSLAISASPTYAVSIDFNTWNKIGNVTSTSGQATITTDVNGALETGGGPSSLEAALAIPNNSLVTNPSDLNSPTQGSAIRNSSFFSSINAGDVFSFDLSLTGDNRDRGFVAITNNAGGTTIESLVPSQTSFSYSFLTSGAYDISIGAVDVGDYVGASSLTASNGNLQPVPEPISIISSIIALGGGATLRKRFGKKA